MNNSIKITTLITFLLLIIPFESFSQDHYRDVRTNSGASIPSYSYKYPRNRYFAISGGSGITYGGIYGAMLSIKPNSSIAISGSIGKYAGIPLGFGGIDEDNKDIPLNKQTLTGIGYSFGIRLSPNDWGGYFGVHYINAGHINYEEMNKESLQGINFALIGGNHSFGNTHFLIDWSVNLALLFTEKAFGGMLGVSLGLGYEF